MTEKTLTDKEAVERLRKAYDAIKNEIGKVIVGQDQVVDELLLAIFSRGHILLEGVPGLAKTLLISTLARCLSLSFHRIQFTPDLMPSDITGTEVIQENKTTGEREFRFVKGPIFANVILADEINRTPPKTQAALLEAMQERQVSAAGERHELQQPFFVLATQNPIEQEGTYPLPEAQQDRFMFKVLVKYPTRDEEREIVNRTTTEEEPNLDAVLSGEEIVNLQKVIRRVPAAPAVIDHAIDIVRRTRVRGGDEGEIPDFVKKWIAWGAGPRAAQYLTLGAKAKAVLGGRLAASTDDVRAVALPVLRHRIVTTFAAESEGIDADKVIERLLKETPPNEGALEKDERVAGLMAKP